MKKELALLLAATLTIGTLAACGSSSSDSNTGSTTTESSAAAESKEMVVSATNEAVETGTKNGNVTAGPDAPDSEKTMVVVQSKSFETLDPMFASGAVLARQRALLWDTLWDIELGASEEVGICAKEWSFSEDGKTVYVTIYDNIHDSEGNSIDAHDFEWCYNKYLENKTLANLTSCVATGDYELEIGLKYAYYAGYLTTATQYLVAINSDTYDPERFISDPITSGQYKVASFTSGASATFIQTYDYWGDTENLPAHRKANVDVCRFEVITENSQIGTALSTNSIQCADITSSIAEDFKNSDVQVKLFPESYPAVFMLNNAKGSIFDGNKALREAIAYALDYEQLCLAATKGMGSVTGVMGNTSLAGYTTDFAKYGYTYDLNKAKEKMAEAGYPDGGIKMTYVTNVDNEVGIVLQACLSEIGIEMEIDLCDETEFLSTRQQANLLEWDLLYLGTVPKGFMTTLMYAICNIDTYAFGNYCGVMDTELADAVTVARYSQDAADIESAYAMLMDRLYYLPTWDDYGYEGCYSKIDGLVKDSSLELIAQASLFADDYDVFWDGK